MEYIVRKEKCIWRSIEDTDRFVVTNVSYLSKRNQIEGLFYINITNFIFIQKNMEHLDGATGHTMFL